MNPTSATVQTTAPNRPRLHAIDGLRALACTSVFLLHCSNAAGKPGIRLHLHGASANLLEFVRYGDTGVHLFLVLSGFCLALAFAGPGRLAAFDARQFYVRRFWRIVPAYYATLAFCLALFPACRMLTAATGLPFAPSSRLGTGWSLPLHLVLLHSASPWALFDLNAPFWTLSLEWEFYLVFPLVLLAMHRRGAWLTMAALLAIDLAYRAIAGRASAGQVFQMQWGILTANIPGRIAEFGLGMLVAWLVARGHVRSWTWAQMIGCGVVGVGAVAAGIVTSPFAVAHDLYWSTAYALLLLAAVGGMPRIATALSVAPLKWLGERSYSMYLVHMPLVYLVLPLLKPHFSGTKLFAALIVTALPVTLIVSAGWYRCFEAPFLRGPPRWWPSRPEPRT